jgi:RHS repeat-associated protein
VFDGVMMHAEQYDDLTPVAGGASLFGVDEGHQGLSTDAETGLVYNRARYLHVTLGRFTSTDPFGYVDGMSLHQYVKSSPTKLVDAFGTCSGPIPPGYGPEGADENGDEHTSNNEVQYWEQRRRAEHNIDSHSRQLAEQMFNKLMGLYPESTWKDACLSKEQAEAEARRIAESISNAISQYRKQRLRQGQVNVPGGWLQNVWGLGCGEWQGMTGTAARDALRVSRGPASGGVYFEIVSWNDQTFPKHQWIEIESRVTNPPKSLVIDPWGSGEAGDWTDRTAAERHRSDATRSPHKPNTSSTCPCEQPRKW